MSPPGNDEGWQRLPTSNEPVDARHSCCMAADRSMAMNRIVVVGCSGSGKTFLARKLAARFASRHIELDAYYNLPGWQERPRTEMRSLVEADTREARWVVDGNYSWLMDLVWGRADTVVVLDLPRRTTMRRLLIRTIRRVVFRTRLW